MAELYLDGKWVDASTGARREIRCPADGSLVAEVDEAGPEDTERGDRGGAPGLPRRPLADHLRRTSAAPSC